MEFSRQKYWSGLLFPILGDLPNPGVKSVSLLLSHVQGYRYHLSKFHIYVLVYCIGISLVAQTVKRLGDLGSSPGSGRSPGEGNGNPLQYSCLENSMDREAWRATVHGVTNSQI